MIKFSSTPCPGVKCWHCGSGDGGHFAGCVTSTNARMLTPGMVIESIDTVGNVTRHLVVCVEGATQATVRDLTLWERLLLPWRRRWFIIREFVQCKWWRFLCIVWLGEDFKQNLKRKIES